MDNKTVIQLRELLVQDAQNRQRELEGVLKLIDLVNERIRLLESQVVHLSTELSTGKGARMGTTRPE